MRQRWKCTLVTSVFRPISQSAVAKCLSCSNKCVFFCKLWKETILYYSRKIVRHTPKFQQAQKYSNISPLLFPPPPPKKEIPTQSMLTMASKADSRLIKSVVFRPQQQLGYNGEDRSGDDMSSWVHKNASLTISLDTQILLRETNVNTTS